MKTKIKLLRAEEVWHPSRGAKAGNRNALRTAMHTAELRSLRARIRQLRAKIRVIAAAPSPVGVADVRPFPQKNADVSGTSVDVSRTFCQS